MSFSDEIRDAALETIAELGTAATLTRVARVYDPVTGVATPTETLHSVVVSPPAPLSVGPRRETAVAEATCYVFLAAKDAPASPEIYDKIAVSGLTLRVLDMNKFYGGASLACWQLFLGA